VILNRNQFFIILFILIGCPFVIHKLIWLLRSEKTTGYMEFTGHGNLGSVLGISTYPVIQFTVDSVTYHFNGNVNIPLRENEGVEIRYQAADPSQAKINKFLSIWGDTITYSLAPLLIAIALFLVPDVVPKKSKVKLGVWPVVTVLRGSE
jgi:hypothetical protein